MLSDEEKIKRKRETKRLWVRRFRQTEKGKLYTKKMDQSPKGRARHKRYLESPHGKIVKTLAQKRCNASDTAKLAKKRCRERLKIYMMNLLGGKCVTCNSIIELRIDHIRGDGRYWRQLFGDSVREQYYYKDHPDMAKMILQLLCKKCHDEKTREEIRIRPSSRGKFQ